jgi:serine/threonine protein kinase
MIGNDIRNIRYLNDELKKDEDIALKMIEKSSDYFHYLSNESRNNEIIALKIINKVKCDKNEIDKLQLEAKILEDMNHPNIVRFKHSKETQTRF